MQKQLRIRINPEYEKIWGSLPKAEYQALKDSIEIDGLLESIKINYEGYILDGHNRYKACRELGIKPDYETIHPEDEKLYIIRTQINRRHATPYHRIENAIPLLYIEKENAANRRTANLPNQPNVKNLTFGEKGRTNEKIGNLVGLSYLTVERALFIDKHGSEEMKARLREDYKYRINNAWSHLQSENRPNPPPLPEGVYDVIYADPPWKYGYGGSMRGKAEMHYPTMDLKDIINLEVNGTVIQERIAEDAMLFLWATNPLLEDALKVVNEWGFKYKTNFVWVKKKIGTGFYNRSQHELLLICRKGDIGTPADSERISSVINQPSTIHSEKPEVFYLIIEKTYPNRQYLELFARNEREGWTSWGNEIGD